jgi:hypothetical protein
LLVVCLPSETPYGEKPNKKNIPQREPKKKKQHMKTKFMILIAALGLATATGGRGAVIASFEETGTGGTITYPVDFINDTITGITLTADPNLDSATLAQGAGATAGTAGGSLGFASIGSGTLSDAITGNIYHSFTLTPSTGYTMNISGVEYNADASNSTSTFNFNLFSNITGFTSGDSLGSFSVVNSAASSGTINLSSVTALQGISSVEFRIYVDRSAGSGTAAYYADDGVNSGFFSVNGAVIPEPSSIILMGLVGLAAVVILRKRK